MPWLWLCAGSGIEVDCAGDVDFGWVVEAVGVVELECVHCCGGGLLTDVEGAVQPPDAHELAVAGLSGDPGEGVAGDVGANGREGRERLVVLDDDRAAAD